MTFAQRGNDFDKIELLESVDSPTNHDKVNLCALLMRYSEDQETSTRLCDLAAGWDYSPSVLMQECREIWLSGYRPDQANHSIGSSNDIDSDS